MVTSTAKRKKVKPVEDIRISPAALAEREDVSLSMVYRWNRLGIGPRYMRVGRTVRYRLADVLDWERESMVGVIGGDDADVRATG